MRLTRFSPRPIAVVAVPLDVGHPMLEMDRARLAVQPQAAPVPHLEGEDVGRGADLQHHRVAARTMHGAGGNQEMVVLPGGPAVGVLRRRRTAARRSAPPPGRGPSPRVDALPQAQVDARVRRRRPAGSSFRPACSACRSVCWMYSVSGCTWKDRLPPPIVSRKSKRMGNSSPKRACTASPSKARGWSKTRSIDGNLQPQPRRSPSSRLFSSGTQSKHQP